jgi:hypothetical protein
MISAVWKRGWQIGRPRTNRKNETTTQQNRTRERTEKSKTGTHTLVGLLGIELGLLLPALPTPPAPPAPPTPNPYPGPKPGEISPLNLFSLLTGEAAADVDDACPAAAAAAADDEPADGCDGDRAPADCMCRRWRSIGGGGGDAEGDDLAVLCRKRR